MILTSAQANAIDEIASEHCSGVKSIIEIWKGDELHLVIKKREWTISATGKIKELDFARSTFVGGE